MRARRWTWLGVWLAADLLMDVDALHRLLVKVSWEGGTVSAAVLKVVTAFTLAHSVTLALGTLGWVRLPSRWVEAVIAASIGVAAVGNLWVWWGGGDQTEGMDQTDRSDRSAWLMALGFGLVHGFGFAGVLGDLGVSGVAMAGPLLGFNAGVELGQVACVALFLPLAYLARRTRFYRVGVLATGSAVLLGLAGFWCFERAFAAGPG